MSAHADPAVLRLVRSVLWPGFLGTTAPDWLRRELDGGLAGAVYFAQNLDPGDSEQVRRLSAQLTDAADAALIGIDEEGGSVTRLESATGSTVPGALQLGELDDSELTRRVGRELGRRVARAGATIVLAPDADVNTNPSNPVIGVRAFGDDAELVCRHVAAMIEGLQAGGVAACAKHFPGHGDTVVDSHRGLPRVGSDIEQHLAPFDAAIAADVAAIMTAHIVVEGRGEEPATLNRGILRGLRERGFDGVIISDALDMDAIARSVGIGGGAVAALLAGVDLLCIGNPANPGTPQTAAPDEDCYLTARTALCAAVDSGVLPLDVLERASERVSALRRADRHPADGPGLSEDEARVAVRKAVSVAGAVPSLAGVPLAILDARDAATNAVALRPDIYTPAFAAIAPSERHAVADALPPVAASATPVLLVDRTREPRQARLLSELATARPDAVVVNTGVPADVLPLAAIEVRGDSLLSALVAAELLAAGFGGTRREDA